MFINDQRKILFIDHDSGRSGSTVSLEYLVKAFRERKYQVIILSPKQDFQKTQFLQMGASLIPLPKKGLYTIELSSHFSNIGYPSFSWKSVVFFAYEVFKFLLGVFIVGKAILKTSPHLIYINEHVVAQASLAASILHIPSVIHIRSHLLEGLYGIRRRLLSRLILKYNRVIFAISKSEKELLSPRVGEKDKIMVVGEFFSKSQIQSKDFSKYKYSHGIPENKLIITMLGGVEEIKGTIIFLQAAILVLPDNPNTHFVIAGWNDKANIKACSYYAKCMQIVDQLRCLGSISMLGEITTSLDLIAISDIIISPSMMTHFSRPIIEAWGFSKPVIASRTEHMLNLIIDGHNGLLFDLGDPQSLASCINQLLKDVKLREVLGIEGKKKVDDEFDAEKNLHIIVDTCDSLIYK